MRRSVFAGFLFRGLDGHPIAVRMALTLAPPFDPDVTGCFEPMDRAQDRRLVHADGVADGLIPRPRSAIFDLLVEVLRSRATQVSTEQQSGSRLIWCRKANSFRVNFLLLMTGLPRPRAARRYRYRMPRCRNIHHP